MPLTVSLMASGLTQPVLDGTIAHPDLDLSLRTGSVDDNTRGMLSGAFDAAEMSMATFVQARTRGVDFVALPIFLGRRFLQSCVAFALAAPYSAGELRGKRIALPQYWMTSSMWHRGLLEHEYGVPATEVEWVTTQPERLDVGFTPGVRVTTVADRPLPALLADGSVDVIFPPRPPARDGTLAFLFDDPIEASLDYLKRTGVYPLLHTIVVRGDRMRERPALGAALYDLFTRAKDYAYAHPEKTEIESPIAGLTFEEVRERLGDPYPFGVRANAAAIDAFLGYAVEQGLTAERLSRDEAFADPGSPLVRNP